MDFVQAKDALLGSALVLIAGYVAAQIREMAKSVNSLNVRIAQVVEMVAHHKETLHEHATRIHHLEEKRKV